MTIKDFWYAVATPQRQNTMKGQAAHTMKIVTYQILGEGIFAMTESERKAAGGIPENWDDFIFQDQPTKEAAILRHDDALDEYTDDVNAGREPMDVY